MNQSADNPEITVRAAEERDVEAIARLAGEFGYPSTSGQVRERFAAINAKPDHAMFVAVMGDDEIAGWIHLAEVRSLEIEPNAEITALVVGSQFRGGGAGCRLVERGEEWARRRGLAIVCVRSNVIRERAHAFYKRLGYVEMKAQKMFRKGI
jgi:predicted N-acetyltransferase YhbS